MVRTKIDDLNVLKLCGDLLQTLDVRHTPLKTLKDASTCFKLRTLDVGNTEIDDLSPLIDCRQLEKIFIDHSNVDSIDCFDESTSLRLICSDLSNLPTVDVSDWLVVAKTRYEEAGKGNKLCRTGVGRSRLLFCAAAYGDLATMQELIDGGVDINERASPRFQSDNMKIYRDLLRTKTKFFDCTTPIESDRPTALHYAIMAGHEDMVALLVRKGALPSLRAKLGIRGIENCTLRAREQDDISLTCAELSSACVREAIFREVYRLVDQKVLDARTYTMAKDNRLRMILKDPEVLNRPEEFEAYQYPLTRTLAQPMTFPINKNLAMPKAIT